MKYKVVKIDNRYEDVVLEKEQLKVINVVLEEYNIHDEEKIIDICKDVDGIIVDLAPMSKRVIENLENCKVISKVGIGTDNIDLRAATEKNIFVCNTPGYCFEEVSNHAVALIFSLHRKICFLNSRVRNDKWNIEEAKPIYPMNELVLGLIGFGSIARLLAKKMGVFGVKILAFDPFVDKKILAQENVESVELGLLLGQSDIISIHCPSNKSTYKMIGIKEFGRMKNSAILINTSRGNIIDSKALYNALNNKEISGAAVDVFDPEPIDFNDPILKIENFIITPHFSFYSERSIEKVRKISAANITQILSGNDPVNVVNREILNK